MKKMFALIVVLAMLAAVPVFAGQVETVTAGSSAGVFSASGTFGNGLSSTLTISNNTSYAGVDIDKGKRTDDLKITTYAGSTGGTFTASHNGITFATQSGFASAYGHK